MDNPQSNKENIMWPIQPSSVCTARALGEECRRTLSKVFMGAELFWKVTPVQCYIKLC